MPSSEGELAGGIMDKKVIPASAEMARLLCYALDPEARAQDERWAEEHKLAQVAARERELEFIAGNVSAHLEAVSLAEDREDIPEIDVELFLAWLDEDPKRWRFFFELFIRMKGGDMCSHSARSSLRPLQQMGKQNRVKGLFEWAKEIYDQDRTEFARSMMGE